MSKFDKVKNALEDKTRDTFNFLTLTKNVDGRHSGKYVTMNVITRQIGSISFRTLNDVIDEYELEVL